MTVPPGTDAPIDETSTASERPQERVWPIPLLIGVGATIVLQLNTAAVVAAMMFPAVGLVIGALIVVGNAVANAAVYRGWTGRWHPVPSALLALLPAVACWGPVFGTLPMAFGLVSSGLGPLLAGAAVAGLATLALPGRWRIAGAITASLVALAVIVPFLLG